MAEPHILRAVVPPLAGWFSEGVVTAKSEDPHPVRHIASASHLAFARLTLAYGATPLDAPDWLRDAYSHREVLCVVRVVRRGGYGLLLQGVGQARRPLDGLNTALTDVHDTLDGVRGGNRAGRVA